MDREDQTTNYYDQHAGEWADKHDTGNFWVVPMEKLKELLPEGKIIEIGSGGGRDAKFLVGTGYDYTGTDISSGLLEIAKKHNPNEEFLQQSVYDLDFEEPFDGFWASAVLLHIPKDRIHEALKSINSVLRVGAIGFISLKEGDGESVDSDNRFFAYYNSEEFSKILAERGFEVLWTEKREFKGTVWLQFIVRKVEANES